MNALYNPLINSLQRFVRHFWMAWYRVRIHRFQSGLLVIAILENPVIKTCRYKFHSDFVRSLIFPKPAMDARTGCDKCSMELTFAHLIVEFVSLVIIGSFSTCGLNVRISVKFIEKLVGRGPGID